MQLHQSPIRKNHQNCCFDGCWSLPNELPYEPCLQVARSLQKVRPAISTKQQPSINICKPTPHFIPLLGDHLRIGHSPTREIRHLRYRNVSSNKPMAERSISKSIYVRNSSCSRRSINVNMLRTSKKPQILCSRYSKSNFNQALPIPNKKLSVLAISNISVSKALCVDSMSTQPFWNSQMYFNKYDSKISNNQKICVTPNKSEFLFTPTTIDHSSLTQPKLLVTDRLLQQSREDPMENTHRLQYSSQTVMQKFSKSSSPTMLNSKISSQVNPHFNQIDRSSESQQPSFLNIPPMEKVNNQRLWTLSAKESESDSEDGQSISARKHNPQQQRVEKYNLFGNLYIREVSESKHDNYEREQEQMKTIRRTLTLPTPCMLGERHPRGSHKVAADKYSQENIDEIDEKSNISMDNPRKGSIFQKDNNLLRDAKTIHSNDGSVRSKSNQTIQRSEVVFRKSAHSNISSLKLYGVKEPTVQKLDIFDFRKKGPTDIGSTKETDVRIYDDTVLHTNIIASHFVKGSLIGVGRFSSWYYARDIRTGLLVMVREIQKQAIDRHNLYQQVQNETDSYRKLDHPNIAAFYLAVSDNDRYYFIMEAGQSTLTGILKSLRTKNMMLNEQQAVQYMRGILLALNYLHQKHHIVHGALSPDRVVIVGDRSKLFDLSYADFATGEQTPTFMPPSVYSGNPVNQETDCWAAGAIAYMLMSKNYVDFNELLRMQGHEIGVEQLNASQAYKQLVRGLVEANTSRRLFAGQALKLGIFRS